MFDLHNACAIIAQAFPIDGVFLSAHQPKRRDYRHADIGCVLPDEVFNAMFPNAPGSIPLERGVVAAVRDDLAIGLQAQRPAGRLPRKRSVAMATSPAATPRSNSKRCGMPGTQTPRGMEACLGASACGFPRR